MALSMDWLQKLYTPSWTSRFVARASTLYGHLDDYQTMAEDAASMTAMKLSTYTENDATDALIMQVFKNALTDCVRERHGFPRPRKWLADFGEIGVQLFKQICLKGRKRSDIEQWVSDTATESAAIPAGAPSLEDAQALALSIFDEMQKVQECAPWCRVAVRDTDDEDQVSAFATIADEGEQPEDQLGFDQMRHFVESMIGAMATDGDLDSNSDRDRMYRLARQSWEELGLDDHDRLVMHALVGRGIQVEGGSGQSEQDLANDLGLTVAQIRNRRKKVLAAMQGVFAA